MFAFSPISFIISQKEVKVDKMRLVIISNRLPVTVSSFEDKLEFSWSSGGLVSGLLSFLSKQEKDSYVWVGWPGFSSKQKNIDFKEIDRELLSKYNSFPVHLSDELMERFYYGFCNKNLWPLFHYFPYLASFNERDWKIYKQVNKIFFDTVKKVIKKDDVVWIHDYHLMLLPKMIKESFPQLPVGFFLHIPFPSYEMFRLLPRKWGIEILEGLSGADLIGFHTYDYTQYFIRCMLRILGYESNLGYIYTGQRLIKADTFPMGIDYEKFNKGPNTPAVKKEKKEIKKRFGKYKIIFSVDRQDYTKGILHRLRAYLIFLRKYPQWHERIVFIMIIIPSRIGIWEYKKIQNRVNEIISQINGEFGSLKWTPLVYQYRSIPFEQLSALYSLSDVALITPLRDGMNLVSKEYVASRVDKKGVLILSEMTGAAMELGEAVVINPDDPDEIANSIDNSLNMSIREQSLRIKSMQERLKRYDIHKWVKDFLEVLFEVQDEQKKIEVHYLSQEELKNLVNSYRKSTKRILFLDYDGTLLPFAPVPGKAKPNKKLINTLKKLGKCRENTVVLISGRDKKWMEKWFGKIQIYLVAEHGAWLKERRKEWKTFGVLDREWKKKILPILQTYKDRLPGSFIEEKSFSLVWHYRNSNPELSSFRIREFMDEIVSFTANRDIYLLQGNKVVEIKGGNINKGLAVKEFLSKEKYDFILCVGDDNTDEDMFQVIPPDGYSVKVGLEKSYARYNVKSYEEVLAILENLLRIEHSS